MGATKSIQEKAMLMDISISQWGARKLDRKVTAEINSSKGASADAGRYNKMLISDNLIKEVTAIAKDARGHFFKNTLPWADGGSRILPSGKYIELAADISRYKSSFEAKVQEVLTGYSAMVQEARVRLNGMFKESDYPSLSVLKSKYGFKVTILPLPSASDFRVDLQNTEVEKIKADILERERETLKTATADLWERVYSAVQNVAVQMAKPKPIVYDSLIGNVQELCKILPALNINDDTGLDSVLADLEKGLSNVDPDSLRGTGAAEVSRREVAKEANSIIDRINQLKGGC